MMPAPASAALVIALLAAMLVMPSRAAAENPLESHLWRERPVLVFAAEGDERSARQISALEAEGGALREREMPVLLVTSDGVRAAVGGSAAGDAAALRRAYSIEPDGFTVILVGKDGGEKLRSGEIVSPADLFSLVDTMPMRRREMGG